eukprot:CAMPEP_0183351304 /NCGR_PEP_ID=MMETSP0164_2-20130417/23745_1 /TAXON_ID=221442 /ORGANISM="Coccolithus pelagicus ssp braarudi, Strain PLY182g" /LENGTH=146 /DNA_ID=CAMNT_0025523451 /DNA_START=73 /DNA_END=513 /DNA_ORIENTATION=-
MAPKKGKKGGKKGKGKKDAMSTDPELLRPYGVGIRDIIQTPLGVQATVLGVQKGDLWLEWPGKIKAPIPSKANNKTDMEAYGYTRQPMWAHIQRSISDRQTSLFQQRYYGGPGPKTATMRLPWPKGFDAAASLPAISDVRPKTAPM